MMQVDQVEYSRIETPDNDGVRVVFTYGDEGDPLDLCDSFDVYGEPNTSMILNMINSQPDPLHLLLALRRMVNMTVH